MPHPSAVIHHGNEFSLLHLRQSIRPVLWICRDNQTRTFSVRVRFSSHCYTEALKGGAPEGAWHDDRPDDPRIFDEARHSMSLYLPGFVHRLLDKPGTAIARTEKRNWSWYVTLLPVPTAQGEKYFMFFRIMAGTPEKDPTPGRIDLFVESAYARSMPVTVFERKPIGRVMEEALGIK